MGRGGTPGEKVEGPDEYTKRRKKCNEINQSENGRFTNHVWREKARRRRQEVETDGVLLPGQSGICKTIFNPICGP